MRTVHPATDPVLPWIVITAAAITSVLFAGLGAVGMHLVWRAARNARARDPQAYASGREPLAPLYYLVSLVLWVGALALAVMLLREPRTARTGAICATLGIVQVIGIALAVCAVFVVFSTEIAAFLPPP
jgi:hypothetical protein